MIEITATNYNQVEAAFVQLVKDIMKFRNRKGGKFHIKYMILPSEEPEVIKKTEGKAIAIPSSTFKSEMELLSQDEDVKNFTFFLEKESKTGKEIMGIESSSENSKGIF